MVRKTPVRGRDTRARQAVALAKAGPAFSPTSMISILQGRNEISLPRRLNVEVILSAWLARQTLRSFGFDQRLTNVVRHPFARIGPHEASVAEV